MRRQPPDPRWSSPGVRGLVGVGVVALVALAASPPAAGAPVRIVYQHPFAGPPEAGASWSLGGCGARLLQPVFPSFHNRTGAVLGRSTLSMGPCSGTAPVNVSSSFASATGDEDLVLFAPSTGHYHLEALWSISAVVNVNASNASGLSPARSSVELQTWTYLDCVQCSGTTQYFWYANAWTYWLNTTGGGRTGNLTSVVVGVYLNATLTRGRTYDLSAVLDGTSTCSFAGNGQGSATASVDFQSAGRSTRLESIRVW